MACMEQNPDKSKNFMEEAAKFQEVITKFKQLHVDLHEYACMRATILFKTGKYYIFRVANLFTLSQFGLGD